MSIFISYRRKDSQSLVGRLREHLVAHFGVEHIFHDVNSIPAGSDFTDVIGDKINNCAVLLVVIGESWADVRDQHGIRRLEDPNDLLRIEVASGLQRDGLLVIPLLVNNASMPAVSTLPEDIKQIHNRNALPIRDDPDFAYDIERLTKRLSEYLSDLSKVHSVLESLEKGKYELNWSEVIELIAKAQIICKQQSSLLAIVNQFAFDFKEKRNKHIESLMQNADAAAEIGLEGVPEAKRLYKTARHLAFETWQVDVPWAKTYRRIQYWEQLVENSRVTKLLIKEFKFTPEELTLNRDGQFSALQLKRIHRMPIIRDSAFGVMSIGLLSIGSMNFASGKFAFVPSLAAMLQPFNMFFFVLGLITLTFVVCRLALYSFRSKSTTSTYKVEIIQSKFMLVQSGQPGSEEVTVRFGHRKFSVSNDFWAAINALYTAQEFRAYAITNFGYSKILSIELWNG